MIQRENFPADLLIFKNWCVWDVKEVGGRITKLPYNPRTLRLAKSNDSSTWCSFEEAARAVEGGAYKGVGFMLSSSPYVCVDLDDCLDGGERETWARGIVAALGSYTEVSQSGKGLHIFGRANVERDRRSDRIEVYGNNRFIAMTGNIYEGHGELKPMQGALDALMASEFPAKEKPAGTYSKMSKTPATSPQGGRSRAQPFRSERMGCQMRTPSPPVWSRSFAASDTAKARSSSRRCSTRASRIVTPRRAKPILRL